MAKTPAAKAPAAKGAAKTAAPKSSAPRTDGIHKPVTPSKDLAAVVGAGPMPRSEVVKKVWDYIKKHDLQNPKNKRDILADDKLEKVFGKKESSMFEMNKHISAHLK